MGGPVQIGVRNSQGDVFSGSAHTSAISPFFDNDRFFKDDEND